MARKKIGLALSGGGARGFAHIGVLRVLTEKNIPIDVISGTSAGSIIAGAFAAGMSADEIDAMGTKAGWTNLVRPSLWYSGLLSSAPMGKFLADHLPVTRFEDCRMPLATVAFDLATNETVVLRDRGDMISAIRASCAVPGVFAPIRDETGRMLVDGGVISPMPVEAARSLGADIVIAVNLLSCGSTFAMSSRTGIGIVLQSALATLRSVSIAEHRTADVVIEPQVAHLRMDEIGKRQEFTKLGAEAIEQKIGAILEAM